MQQSLPIFDGWLTAGNTRKRIKARFASAHSLWVELEPGAIGEHIENLELAVEDKIVAIGSCREIPEPDAPNGMHRLVPVADIFDLKKLFFKSQIETLESATLNLSLALGYKKKIDHAFRQFVSDLTYDLNVYMSMLDRMDSEGEGEPPAVAGLVQERIIEGVGPRLSAYMDESLEELQRIVSGFSEEEHLHHGLYFRRQLWNIILRAPIMARTNLKPRGYAGDSEMMRMIYLDGYQGDSTFGRILHRHAVGLPAAEAIRKRRTDVASMIHRYMEECHVPPSQKVRVLSVGCGPALEVRDIIRNRRDSAAVHFSLLDQDQQALLEAAGLVDEMESSLDIEISVDFIRESVRTMLGTDELQERWGKFHFIYAMSLFDYLTLPTAVAVIKKLYSLLRPEGEMVIGIFSQENPTRFYMEYWLDWKIFHRTRADMDQLASGLAGARTELQLDDTGIQMLMRVRGEEAQGHGSQAK